MISRSNRLRISSDSTWFLFWETQIFHTHKTVYSSHQSIFDWCQIETMNFYLSIYNKNEICTRTMWNMITSTEMFKFTMSIKKISSMSNLKKVILFLFKINVVSLIRCRVVNCSMSSDEKSAASWSINMFLNLRSSYFDAMKTL
jgi:hypothetical protein